MFVLLLKPNLVLDLLLLRVLLIVFVSEKILLLFLQICVAICSEFSFQEIKPYTNDTLQFQELYSNVPIEKSFLQIVKTIHHLV